LVFWFVAVISPSGKTPYANKSHYAIREIKMPPPVAAAVDDTSTRNDPGLASAVPEPKHAESVGTRFQLSTNRPSVVVLVADMFGRKNGRAHAYVVGGRGQHVSPPSALGRVCRTQGRRRQLIEV